MRTHSGSGNEGRTTMQPIVPKDGCSSSWPRRLSNMGEACKTPLRFFKAATEGESSGDEFGILEDDRCIGAGVFQRRYLVHELVFACPPPPPRLQTSHTILTQADFCAVRAVARCEQSGCRVFWH